MLYDDSKKDRAFDLIIISDVASPYMNPYKSTKDKKDTSFRRKTLKQILTNAQGKSTLVGSVIFALALICALIPLRNNYAPDLVNGFCVGLATGWLILLAVKVWAVSKVKNILKYVRGLLQQLIPEFYYDKLKHLKIEEMTFGRAEPLVLDRINSLIILLMDVFLKVVRRLNYDKLYDNEKYQYKRISNLIKELTEQDFTNKMQRKSQLPSTTGATNKSAISRDYHAAVGPNIKPLVEDASAFGTTLWFNDKPGELHSMLDKLVATGQLTMCYNLIVYLEALMFDHPAAFGQYPQAKQQELQNLYSTAVADWERFRANPMFMVNSIEQSGLL